MQQHILLINFSLESWDPSPTLARDKTKIEYMSGGQLSPYEQAFGVESDLNPHSKIVSESILDPLKGHPPYYPCTKPKSVGCEGVYWEKLKSHIN